MMIVCLLCRSGVLYGYHARQERHGYKHTPEALLLKGSGSVMRLIESRIAAHRYARRFSSLHICRDRDIRVYVLTYRCASQIFVCHTRKVHAMTNHYEDLFPPTLELV